MPENRELAEKQWRRYAYGRDAGHLRFIEKAAKCEDFFAGAYAGGQWDVEDLQRLRNLKRPALTINRILSSLSNVFGDEIENRAEISYKATYGAPANNAGILTKVARFIGDHNQLKWLRNELFCDGSITSRGYYDLRMTYEHNASGDATITTVNPKNVIPDPDAAEYDPDSWGDVIITKWNTVNDIEQLYNKADADALRNRIESCWEYGYDSISQMRDNFSGGRGINAAIYTAPDESNERRYIRTIDRQYRKLSKVRFFLDKATGDKRQIPDAYDRDMVTHLLQTSQNPNLAVIDDTVKRVRWTVTAEDRVLFDEWSPYKHFTIIPYFPYFRYGKTIGLVENLIDPQELFNKTLSQELHVVNTSANSGWVVQTGTLQNMTPEDLEEHGADTGLVLEVNTDVDKAIKKIQPNQIPQGLDRLSSKAENAIGAVLGRDQRTMGMAREDVSGDAIGENREASSKNITKPLDNLARTDYMLGRNLLDLMQEHYTDARILSVTNTGPAGEQEEVSINWPDPTTGEILNDITLGSYTTTVSTTKAKQTLDSEQFEQAAAMRKDLGIQIPDEFLIQNSNLIGKDDIIKALRDKANSPVALLAQQVQVLTMKLQVAEGKAGVAKTEADATLKNAKAAKEVANTAKVAHETATAPDGEEALEQKRQEHTDEMQMSREKHEQELQIQRENHQMDQEMKRKQGEDDRQMKKAQTLIAMRDAKKQQTTPQPGA